MASNPVSSSRGFRVCIEATDPDDAVMLVRYFSISGTRVSAYPISKDGPQDPGKSVDKR